MQINEYTHGLYGSFLDLNLNDIKKSCLLMEERIHNITIDNVDTIYGGISPKTTKKFRYYNLLVHPLPGFHSLYFAIQKMFYKCASEYFENQIDEHYMQCWLNVYNKGEFIDWHTHFDPNYKAWHGFFCVDVEPDSFTSYTWDNGQNILNVRSVNNLLVLGLSDNDEHRSSEWNHDHARITIAFDIVPLSKLFNHAIMNELLSTSTFYNHWMPI